MMGYEAKENQGKLFCYRINIEERNRGDDPVHKIAGLIKFDFDDEEVKESYRIKGNVLVPTPVILKLMLLLVLHNVRSNGNLWGR